MAILSEAEVQEILETTQADLNRIESEGSNTRALRVAKNYCQKLNSLAETCLAAMAEVERLREGILEGGKLQHKTTCWVDAYRKALRAAKQRARRLSEALARIGCRHPQPVHGGISAHEILKYMPNGAPYRDCKKCDTCLERAKEEEEEKQ